MVARCRDGAAPLRVWLAAFGVTLLSSLAAPALAAPDLASRRYAGPLLVYADDQRPDLYYYAPPEIRLAQTPEGRPDFTFLDARYTGNVVARDRGLVLHRSLVTFRVLLPAYRRDELAAATRTLDPSGRAELRPLPIRRLEAALVYASIGGAADTSARVVPGGQFGGASDRASDDAYWNERVFTVGLDSLTAQALRQALEQGQLAFSLGYAFVAEGRLAAEPFGDVEGPPELADALRRQLATESLTEAGRDSTSRRVVRAGAIRIGVDAQRWPDLMRRVDLDGGIPAGYAALDVYCYDFRDARRPDLYSKAVEIEAESVGGQPVQLQAVFARDHPDVWMVSARFPVAVKLDRPYRYRVVEWRPDGSSTKGRWSESRTWVQLLDVTTPAFPSARGVRPIR